MKPISVTSAALTLTCALACAPAAGAASWNNVFGIGSPNDGYLIGGSGAPLAVIPSVQSNSVYWVSSALNSGEPQIETVWLQNDFVSGTLGFYVATNTWTCASNQPAGTNIIWLTSTNNTMATNDVLVLRTVSSDSYQLLLVSGNATDAFGSVYSNSVGHVGFKVWNTPTNTITAGDKIYKMALQQSYTPLGMAIVTNQIIAVPAAHFGTWVKLGSKEQAINFAGPLGVPTAVVMTYSNAADLQVSGRYIVRPRR